MPIRSRAISAALLTIVLVAGQMPATTAADAPPHVWRGQPAQPPPSHIRWAGRAPGVRGAVPFGPAITGSRLRRLPAVSDARTGKTLALTSTKAMSVTVAASGVRRTLDVNPPASAGCKDYGGDVWACDVIPGMSYDLPVSSTIESYSDPSWVCSAAYPVFYWTTPPPHGISVTLLNASGSSSCGSTWTGTVRVTLSTQAPWENNGPPDFTFKLVYTLCQGMQCTTGQNGFAQTGGTRYTFWTPYPAHGFPTIPERACGRCNGTTIGKPIDVATGEVWDEKTDLALSGPFGLSFTRFYGNQTAGSADLGGTTWLHTYAAVLDVSSLSNGNVTYWDNRGMPYYFSSVTTGGAAAYDNASGMSLALSSDGSTYTLTSFDARTWTFDAAGELLAMHDRVGNAQTIVRDAANANRIASVADSAGRQLCFYYDAANRIVGVAAWMSTAACPASVPGSSVTTPVVTLAYNTGVNCSANSLCAVTEPDGNAWTYQYTASDTTYPYNLSEALDPLADPEEINGFSGNRITHQETGSCPAGTSPCGETGGYVDITYPASGSTTATITDGLGRTSSITYDPNTLLLTRISGPICRCGGDQTRMYAYDASQRLTSESDDAIDGSVKHTTTFAYGRDAGGRTYPGPTAFTETVDTSGKTRTTSLAYYAVGDSRQDLVQTTQRPSVDYPGQFVSTSDTYSATGLLTQRTTTGYVNQASTAYTWRWAYDSRGRLVSQTSPRTDLSATTTFQYFADTATDAAVAGQLSKVTDALGHSVQYAAAGGFASYTPFGDPQSAIDSNGVITEYGYDARGRLVSSIVIPAAEGDQTLTTLMVYDAAGHRVQRILPAGNSTFFRYDTSGRLSKTVRADAAAALRERVKLTYNAFDQVSSVSAQTCTVPATTCGAWAAAAFSSSNTYSSTTSDLVQTVNADNTAKSLTYTAQGAVATLNDENHATGSDYTYTYDLAGRRLSEVRVLAGAAGGVVTTRYAYDLNDNVISVTDPNNNATTYRYDDFGRLAKETSPVTGVTSYSYDSDDNLTSMVNANGTTAVYTYDALDRVLTETDTKGSTNASEVWTYDDTTVGHFGIGRLATMTDPSGSTAYSYDRRGNVEVESHNVAGNMFTYGYDYDPNGNRYEVTYPDGTIVNYTFDFADRPYSAQQIGPQDPNTLSVGRRVRSLGRLRMKGLAAPNHAAKSELAVRPSAVTHIAVAVPPGRGAITPGRGVQQPPTLGRRPSDPASMTRHAASSMRPDSTLVTSAAYAPFGPMTSIAFGNGTTQTIAYNQRYLPQENKLVGAGRTLADHVYTLDAVGNITGISDALDSGYGRTFSYDDLNRLIGANSGSKLWGTASGNGYTYDAMGNMLSAQLGASHTDTFTYRAGQVGPLPLLASDFQNGTTTYSPSYDAVGSELTDGVNTMAYGARELMGSALLNVTAYAYDGFRRRVQTQTSGGLQRVSLYDTGNRLLAESAASSTPSSIAYDYVWFGDRPVAQLDATSTYYTFSDHIGTPLIQTDSTAAVSWQAEHEPYGQLYALRAADVHQPLRFPGQEAQQFDNGANGINAMSYNGARWYHARWGRYIQNDPVRSGTPYGYGAGNPISMTDPLGEQASAVTVPIARPIDIPQVPPVPWYLIPFVLLTGSAGPSAPPAAPYSIRSCPNPNRDPKCKDLVDELIEKAAIVQDRYNDMVIDKFNLYRLAYGPSLVPGFPGTWLGHQEQFGTRSVSFWRTYARAIAARCAIPPDLFRYLRKPPKAPGGSQI